MTTIKLKNGSGAPLAGDLVQGEPALDLTNKRLYTEDSGGTVIEVGTNPTSLTTGTFTSTGIDDNATSTAITIDSSQNTTFAGTITSGDITVSEGTPFLRLQDTDGTNQYTHFTNTNGNTYFGSRNDTADGNILIGGYGGNSFTEFARWSDAGNFTQENNLTVLGAFTSLGIDDNASSTVMTIASSGETTFANDVVISAASPAITLDNSDSPNSELQIVQGSGSSFYRARGVTGNGVHVFQRTNGTDTLKVFQTNSIGDVIFYDDDGSTEGMRWDASANRLGIGESAPDEELHIKASNPTIKLEDEDGTDQDFRILENNGQASLIAQNGTSFGNTLFRRDDGTNLYSILNLTANGDVDFYDDGGSSIGMRWDASTDRLGIGTTSPAEILHVSDTSTAGAVGLRAENSEGHVNFTTNGGGFQFETGASGVVTFIDSNGALSFGGASNYGTSGQVLTSNGSGSAPSWQDASGGGGSGSAITEADNWRLTADISADTDPISANLERVDDASFAKIGTGMSVSSGIWTFPSTGLWEIGNYLTAFLSNTDAAVIIRTYVSTNGGTNWVETATSRTGYSGAGSSIWQQGHTVSYVNVTNTTNVKVKFLASSMVSGNLIKGNTGSSQTQFTFKRLGDSQ